MVSSSVSVTAVVFLGVEIADVVVVEVDVDEGAQLALGGEEMLLELGVGGGELREHCVDGGAGDGDSLFAAGVGAQRSGDVDLHACPFWCVDVGPFHDLDGFVVEFFVVFGGAGEQEGVGRCGLAFFDAGDDVGAADPVGFGEVGRRPLGRVVGVGVVEADDVEARAAGLALDFDELLRGDVVAVVRGVGAGVAGADDLVDDMVAVRSGVGFAEEDTAALVGVGLFAVGAQGFVVGVLDAKHGLALPARSARSCICRRSRRGW